MAAAFAAEAVVTAKSVKSSEPAVEKGAHAAAQERGRVHRKVQTLSCYTYPPVCPQLEGKIEPIHLFMQVYRMSYFCSAVLISL